MHTCSICQGVCACNGDTDRTAVSQAEAPGCSCCIAKCEHGIEFGQGCAPCDTEGFKPEPDARSAPEVEPPARGWGTNGGW